MSGFQIEPLAKQNVSVFDAGLPEPLRYLKKGAASDMQRGRAMTFVAVEPRGHQVIGFYTLAPRVVAYGNTQMRVIVLKHLAHDVNVAEPEIGTALLADARRRAMRPGVGVTMMVVETQDPRHSDDFVRFGFTRDPGNDNRLFARLDRIKA